MDQHLQLAVNVLSAKSLIASVGVIGILAIVFAETGLLVGFFFPGDSLLILAGVASSSAAAEILGDGAQMNIVALLIGAPLCAIVGAQLGHLLGRKIGPRMFDKPNSKIFRPEYVEKAEEYFEKFGPAKAVVMARFIPIVRTFLNPVAGTLQMPARTFFVWNVVGGVLWTEMMLLIGYFAGDQLAGVIDKYLLLATVLIVLLSVSPIAVEVIRERRKKKGVPTDGPGADNEPVSSGRHRKN
ncbi:DedA family protein [Kitasatospora phosalacinea]|uniref:DedA family protein n=1 Tax=Kitasatospora phosalacinea TaxID=2065 RepID=A0ABW6GXD9_9ACTN